MPPKRNKRKLAKGKDDASDDVFVPDEVDPRKAPVPKPIIESYTCPLGSDGNRRSANGIEKGVIKAAKHAAHCWKNSAPTFKIKGLKLSTLEKRPKNAEADIEKANNIIKNMESTKADAGSARYLDEDGKPLVCVFSRRLSPNTTDQPPTGASKPLIPYYTGSEGRTLTDYESASRLFWDGIPKNVLARYHEAAQMLHAHVPPVANVKDIRHPSDKIMEYSVTHDPESSQVKETVEYYRSGLSQTTLIGQERTGTWHGVHAWAQQGHPNGPLTHSRDMAGRTCTAQRHVRQFYQLTRPTALHIKERFRVAFPEYFSKYEAAFEAGVWEKEDPGPFLGRVTVWKLQVETHQDGLDEGPAAIFNYGSYTGGILYLPDLHLKISYEPGELVFLMAGRLYHHVSEWVPKPKEKDDKLTPGRVGNVFFFPKISYERLKNKPPGWNYGTSSGSCPNVGQSTVLK